MPSPTDLYLVGWEQGDYPGVGDDYYLLPRTAITHVNSQQTVDASGTTVVVTKPTGLQNGDVMIAHVVVLTTGTTHTAPAGWEAVGGDVTISTIRISQWIKVVTDAANEPANYTFTTGSASKTGRISAYRGVSVTDPINDFSSASSTTGSTLTAPSVAATRTDCLVVACFASALNTTLSDPMGATVRSSDESGASTTSSMLVDIPAGSTGNTPTVSTTAGSSGAWAAHTIVLNEAPPNEILFVASSVNTSNNVANNTVNKPTGTVNGDLMIMAGVCTGDFMTAPGGWTLLQSETGNPAWYVWYRVASGEGASYTVTHAANDSIVAIATYRNVDSTPINVSADLYAAASSATIDVPDATSTVSDGLAVHIGSMLGAVDSIFVHPRATLRAEFDNTAGVSAVLGISDELLGAAGTVTGRDWTLGAAKPARYGALVVLAPSTGVAHTQSHAESLGLTDAAAGQLDKVLRFENQIAVLVTT